MRSTTLTILIFMLSSFTMADDVAKSSDVLGDLNIMHRNAGQSMDKYYYDAGTTLDIVMFDLKELVRQGRDVSGELLDEIEQSGLEMNKRWLELESRRAKLYDSLRILPVGGSYIIKIYDLENTSGSESGWLGFRSVGLKWQDGSEVDVPIKTFRNAVYRDVYNYLCEASPAVFIYGSKTFQGVTAAGFDVACIPGGDAALVISGLDNDKPTKTRIRIEVNGRKIFEGENPFKKVGWSEHEFKVSAELFANPAESPDRILKQTISDFKTLQNDIESFGEWAAGVAEKYDSGTQTLRNGLEYQTSPVEKGWWKNSFLRGLCFESTFCGEFPAELQEGAYSYDYYEYVAKSLYDIGGNMIYSYNKGDAQQALIGAVDKVGIPYIQCGWGWEGCAGQPWTAAVDDGPWRIRDQRYYANREAHLKDCLAYADCKGDGHSCFAGLAVDEPVIDEGKHHPLDVTKDEVMLDRFKKYIDGRKPIFAAKGIEVPSDAKPVTKVEKGQDRPMFMEWQNFKMEAMGSHFDWLLKACDENGLLLFPIIMNRNEFDPELGSYVSMGRLPLISTDLYHNATMVEGMMMQLMRNASKGKAFLTAGAAYASRTPGRFARSLAVGMTHADGVLQWIDFYSSKYRNPQFFWRFGKDGVRLDDRGRDMLSNWYPEAWGIQKEYFRKMREAQEYLMDAESVSDILYLRSEKTVIADVEGGAREYSKGNLGLYSDLINLNLPLNACFVENIVAKKLSGFNVAVLADAFLLSDKEAAVIREWVRGGGTLIATGKTSIYDEWGREGDDFALRDVFGVSYKGTKKGANRIKAFGRNVAYNKILPYCDVVADKRARVVAKYDNGDAAVVSNRFGKGCCWYLTAERAGQRVKKKPGLNGLYYQGHDGLDKLLKKIIKKDAGQMAVEAVGLPEGVEYQLCKKGDDYIVHFVDWNDERVVENVRLRMNDAGQWKAFYPYDTDSEVKKVSKGLFEIGPIRVSEMVVLTKGNF